MVQKWGKKNALCKARFVPCLVTASLNSSGLQLSPNPGATQLIQSSAMLSPGTCPAPPCCPQAFSHPIWGLTQPPFLQPLEVCKSDVATSRKFYLFSPSSDRVIQPCPGSMGAEISTEFRLCGSTAPAVCLHKIQFLWLQVILERGKKSLGIPPCLHTGTSSLQAAGCTMGPPYPRSCSLQHHQL